MLSWFATGFDVQTDWASRALVSCAEVESLGTTTIDEDALLGEAPDSRLGEGRSLGWGGWMEDLCAGCMAAAGDIFGRIQRAVQCCYFFKAWTC